MTAVTPPDGGVCPVVVEVNTATLDAIVETAEARGVLVHAHADDCSSWACRQVHRGGTNVPPRRGYDSLAKVADR